MTVPEIVESGMGHQMRDFSFLNNGVKVPVFVQSVLRSAEEWVIALLHCVQLCLRHVLQLTPLAYAFPYVTTRCMGAKNGWARLVQ